VATGSGLDAQLGIKAETTYGTPVTVDRFVEFDSESLVWSPNWREPSGLRPGRRFKRLSRLAKTREGVSGGMQMQVATRDMGLFFKMALFSQVTTPTTIVAPATKQIHIPSDLITSATIQIGRPEPQSTTVRAHTYTGCVCTGWELSVDDGETLNLSMDFDGRTESTATALATASYTAGVEVFDFSDSSNFKLGGTASTTSGLISVASGVAVPGVVTAFSLSGDNSMALERYGLGNQGLKNAPRINDFAAYTGSLTAEYDRTTWYDPFKVGTGFALQQDFIGSAIGATGSNNTVSLIAPKIVIKGAGPQVGGPDLVTQTVEFEVYDDEVNAPLQVVLISADATTAL
jgi:hypothetical protein